MLSIRQILVCVFICTFSFFYTACGPKLEIRDDLPEEAFVCMERYGHRANPDDPFVRINGEKSPQSAFSPLNTGKSAFKRRLALLNTAQESLVIQALIWNTDETGIMLILQALAAADRGVHVRIMMDDFFSTDWSKYAAVLTTHPNIDIKLFNPFKKLRGTWAGRGLELVSDLDRLNHRLHNKLILADNKVAIVGGRNIGNEYFGRGKKLDYRDYDLVASGPIVKELAESFEFFWNSLWAYRVSDLSKEIGGPEKIEKLRLELNSKIEDAKWLKQTYDTNGLSDHMVNNNENVMIGTARAVFDCPPPETGQFPVQTVLTINKVASQTKGEILMISPYFVPLDGFHNAMKATVARGVRITLLTNSLAATDHTISFSGYKKHRVELLKTGVGIHELKPDGKMWPDHKLSSSKAKHIALHAKVFIFDRRYVYVGSMNLDPRAIHWNTELGLLIDSPRLAERIYRDFGVDLKAENSWRVEWRSTDENSSKGELVWASGAEESTRESSKGILQRFNLWFFSLFPIDQQL